MKRIVLILVITSFLVMSFAGCSINKNANKTNPNEIPTLTYMLPSDPGTTVTSDTWIIKKWGEAVGAKFEIQSVPRDTFREKLTATLASSQIPDMINYYQDVTEQTYKNYGPRLFVPLDEYIKNGKLNNLKKWLDKFSDIEEKTRHLEDNKLYGFPNISNFGAVNSMWTVRNDLLKKGGMDADNIKTLDDLKKAILVLKERGGNQYVTSSRLGWNYFSTYTSSFFGASPSMTYDNRFSNGSKKFVYGPAQPTFKTWVEFYRWMYDNKLINPSFITMQQQELFAGYRDGTYTLCMEQATMGYQLGGEDKLKYPEREEKHIFPVEINGERPKQPLLYHQNIGYRWPVTISKKSKYIDSAIKAMDWCYSEEGINTLAYGEEGTHWKKDDSYIAGKQLFGYRSNTTDAMLAKGKMTQQEFEKMPKPADLGINNWWLLPVISEHQRYGLVDKTIEKKDIAMFSLNALNKYKSEGNVLPTDPIVDFTKAENDEIASILTPLDTLVSENAIKFILGGKSMSEWNNFMVEMEKMNYKKLEDIYNKKLK